MISFTVRVICGLSSPDAIDYYRLRWAAEALAKQGHDIKATRYPHIMVKQIVRSGNSTDVIEIVELPKCDVFVWQRPAAKHQYQVMRLMQDAGIACVVETDDTYSHLHPRHPIYEAMLPHKNPDNNSQWLRRCCADADLVTCTTPFLANFYAPHGRVKIIPNYVPRHYFDIKKKSYGKSLLVGWAGNVSSHIDDLLVCGDGVANAIAKSSARFGVVGSGRDVARQLQLGKIKMLGQSDFAGYPKKYSRLDIAIAPLQPSKFNEGKSWLKMLEAASLGIPCVGSPTSPYLHAEAEGLGLIARTPSEWEERLTRLIEDRAYLRDMSDKVKSNAYRFVLENHVVEWLQAWEIALETRRNA